MFKNYLIVAFRNIFKYKVYSGINIFSLAIGITCSILILLWVQDELSYDRFHKQSDNILKMYLQISDGDNKITTDQTYSAVANDLKSRYPEIRNSARFVPLQDFIFKAAGNKQQYTDKLFLEKHGAAVDPAFLEMFTFPLLEGDPANALENPNSILLTRESAQRYFGTQNAIGKTIIINNQYPVMIAGILENTPSNSHLKFDYLLPINFLKKFGRSLNDYSSNSCKTYLLVYEPSSAQALINKIQTEYDQSIPLQNLKIQHIIEPLSRVHLYGFAFPPRIIVVLLLMFVAITILVIASINFINLSTARSLTRSREIGVRKVIGAKRFQLIKQFLSESTFLAFLALIIAIFIIYAVLPFFNQLTGKQISFNLFHPQTIIGLLGIIGFTGILAGSYPALYLSGYSPLHIIKGSLLNRKQKQGKSGKARLRKFLVVTQFVLTIILIINILNGFRWDEHMDQLNFDKDNVIYLQCRGDLNRTFPTLKNELLKNPHIQSVSNSAHLPLAISSSIYEWGLTNDQSGIMAGFTYTGLDYADIFKLKIVEGRYFSKEFPSDKENAIVINEKTVKTLGLKDPVGTRLYVHNREYSVIGVIQDFHFMPKIFEIYPLILRLRPNENEFIFIRVETDENNQPVEEIASTMDYIKRAHKKINPDYPFELFFLNEFIFEEAKLILAASKLVLAFTIFGIFIAALGLFGLSSYLIEQRRKEIGIRKVLGASVNNVLTLLSKDYLKLILIANLIAWPISYFVEQAQTNFFAYSIDFSFWLFAIAGSFVLFIAFLAVGMQSYLASKRNPVSSLRYE